MDTWKRQSPDANKSNQEIHQWLMPGGGGKGRQIDYLAVSRRYRNDVRKVTVRRDWGGDHNKERQHAAIITQI